MLKGNNGGILPLRVFDCVCFVIDNKPMVRNLDPRDSATQKGDVCWSPR
jgi:hypothetical protein